MEFLNYLTEKGKREGIIKNVVGAIITDENNNILVMSRKQDDFMGGIDELPSGNMEPGENIKEALIREIKEETNLDLKEIVAYISSFDYLSSSGKKARQYNFVVRVENTDNIILTEHDSYEFQSVDKVLANEKITDEVKEAVRIFKFNFKYQGD